MSYSTWYSGKDEKRVGIHNRVLRTGTSKDERGEGLLKHVFCTDTDYDKKKSVNIGGSREPGPPFREKYLVDSIWNHRLMTGADPT